jgi:hypothetical protein
MSENRVNDDDRVKKDSEPSQNNVEGWLAELDSIPADPTFMKERNQPKTPKREIFD